MGALAASSRGTAKSLAESAAKRSKHAGARTHVTFRPSDPSPWSLGGDLDTNPQGVEVVFRLRTEPLETKGSNEEPCGIMSTRTALREDEP
jgi:hypothetical protein